jgi:hypothetical protein
MRVMPRQAVAGELCLIRLGAPTADVLCTRGWGGNITVCGPRTSERQGISDWFSDAPLAPEPGKAQRFLAWEGDVIVSRVRGL